MNNHNVILQLRADATALNQRIFDLKGKGVKDYEIAVSINILYASDYEHQMYGVWYALDQRWSVQEVDAALIRAGIPPEYLVPLKYQIVEKKETELTKRLYTALP